MNPPPPPTVPAAPGYLDENLRKRWDELAPPAAARGTLTASSADAFARYVIAEQEYLRAVQRVLSALRTGNTSDAAVWSQVQDRFFRELQSGARMFGLSPDSTLI